MHIHVPTVLRVVFAAILFDLTPFGISTELRMWLNSLTVCSVETSSEYSA